MARMYANDVEPQQAQQRSRRRGRRRCRKGLAGGLARHVLTSGARTSPSSAERQNILVAGLSFVILALIMFQANAEM